MKRVDETVSNEVSRIKRQNPYFVEWLMSWYTDELEKLPHSSEQNTARLQGRCCVLSELTKLFKDAP